ncbi:MAG: Na+/H+ antiporter subunit E [Halanaerobiales bacterium]
MEQKKDNISQVLKKLAGEAIERFRPRMSFVLLIFWIILTSSLDLQSLSLGIITILFINFLWGDFLLDKNVGLLVNLQSVFKGFVFLKNFIIEMVKANIQVAKIVLHPDLPIDPVFIRFRIKLKKSASQVLLANVITLTPGTLSVYLKGDEIIVHALTREDAEGIVKSQMESDIITIEEVCCGDEYKCDDFC